MAGAGYRRPRRARALQHAIDRIHGRWGARGVVRGTAVPALSGARASSGFDSVSRGGVRLRAVLP